MAFVSYAQNFEDVMLARALAEVERGFYIDVGAQDPEDDSVTKHFYDKGWRGMNFEPSEHYFARLEAERPRDVNLCSAVGAESGSVTFYEEEGTGLSTIVEAVSTAERRVARSVPMTTLDAACAAQGVGIVHFLKVDVEGAEELVLRGMALETVRPWVILLEATRPNSPEPYYEHWELLLTERGYDFVYADGLNRFYLAQEKHELARHFVNPPNIFDDFIRLRERRVEDNLAHHLTIIERLGQDGADQQSALEEHAARIRVMSEQVTSMAHQIAAQAHQLAGQQAEIERLAKALGESSKRVDALTFDAGEMSKHINLLISRIAFRDAKVAWLTLDRDRFREAHRKITQSLFWRLTGPLQNQGLREATRARRRYTRPAASAAPPAPPPVELPESVQWFARQLG